MGRLSQVCRPLAIYDEHFYQQHMCVLICEVNEQLRESQ